MYEIIKQLCEKNGTSITALCEKITGSKGNLSTWKKDNVRNDYLLKIAEYFNVSTDYLLGNESKTINLPSERERHNITKMELFGTVDVDDEVYEEVKTFAKLAYEKSKLYVTVQVASKAYDHHYVAPHTERITKEFSDQLRSVPKSTRDL